MNQQTSKNALRQIAVGNVQRLRKTQKLQPVQAYRPSKFNILVKLKGGSALLFNSVTRAMCRLDPKEHDHYRAWKEGSQNGQNADGFIVQALAADGFLVPRDVDEMAEVRKSYFNARHDQNSMMLTIAPTMACNLACGYCYQGLNKDLSKLDTKVPDAIYNLVNNQREKLSSLNVTWYGGEPLMGKQDIFRLSDRLIALCDKNAIAYSSSIVTNGYFLTAEVAGQLYARRCSMAQVTIDGKQETHDKMRPLTSGRGSYEVIMNNLVEVLDETAMSISLRVNVGRDNVDECDELLEEFASRKFAERGRFQIYFAPIDASTPESGTAYEEGLSKRDFNKAVLMLSARARDLGLSGPVTPPSGFMGMCVAAKENGYVITPKGDVHKCWETAHDPTKRVGTIFDPDGLKGSLNADLWQAWSPFDSSVCADCSILPMCGGHCGHRFIYQGVGDDNSLPCPDWKWNTAEYLFSRAKWKGVVEDNDWLEEEATGQACQSGRRHSPQSLLDAQKLVLDKVSSKRGEEVDREYLLKGDGRFFEGVPVTRASVESGGESG